MLKIKLNPVELKAIRLALGLDVSEASAICGVSTRMFQYYEIGGRDITEDVIETFTHYAHVYWLVLKNMGEDIEAWEVQNPIPQTDDTEEYARLIKKRPKLTMPFFRTLQEFEKATGNGSSLSFKVYNSVVSHYFTLEDVKFLSDGGEIPKGFKQTIFWVSGGYDNK